jgi:hypothetical protein
MKINRRDELKWKVSSVMLVLLIGKRRRCPVFWGAGIRCQGSGIREIQRARSALMDALDCHVASLLAFDKGGSRRQIEQAAALPPVISLIPVS